MLPKLFEMSLIIEPLYASSFAILSRAVLLACTYLKRGKHNNLKSKIAFSKAAF